MNVIEKIPGGQFQMAVDFSNQLTVESPVLSALIYNVCYHQSAGWPHRSQGSLPDITIVLVWLVWQESKTNTLLYCTTCAAGTLTISIRETDCFSASLPIDHQFVWRIYEYNISNSIVMMVREMLPFGYDDRLTEYAVNILNCEECVCDHTFLMRRLSDKHAIKLQYHGNITHHHVIVFSHSLSPLVHNCAFAP